VPQGRPEPGLTAHHLYIPPLLRLERFTSTFCAWGCVCRSPWWPTRPVLGPTTWPACRFRRQPRSALAHLGKPNPHGFDHSKTQSLMDRGKLHASMRRRPAPTCAGPGRPACARSFSDRHLVLLGKAIRRPDLRGPSASARSDQAWPSRAPPAGRRPGPGRSGQRNPGLPMPGLTRKLNAGKLRAVHGSSLQYRPGENFPSQQPEMARPCIART